MSVAGGDEVNCSDEEFIDDKTNVRDQTPSDYRLINMMRDLQEAMQDCSMAEELNLVSSDPKNFVSNYVDETEYKYDEFSGFEKRIRKFKQDLKIFEEESKDSFYHAILYDTYYFLLEEKQTCDFCCDQQKLGEVLGWDFFDKLEAIKQSLQHDLSLSTCETQCHVENDLLMSKNLFLRVEELREKFCYLIKMVPKGKNVIQKDLPPCVGTHFNDFELVRRIAENKPRQLYKPVDIAYRPVSHIDHITNCYFSKSMRNAYQVPTKKNRCCICNCRLVLCM